jgi:hypothetical protein
MFVVLDLRWELFFIYPFLLYRALTVSRFMLLILWIYTQSVGLLGRVIGQSQGLYLNTGHHKHRINAHTPNIHAPSGIGTHGRGVRANEEISCLRPLGYRDRRMRAYRGCSIRQQCVSQFPAFDVYCSWLCKKLMLVRAEKENCFPPGVVPPSLSFAHWVYTSLLVGCCSGILTQPIKLLSRHAYANTSALSVWWCSPLCGKHERVCLHRYSSEWNWIRTFIVMWLL